MSPHLKVDITSADFKRNPYPFYARLRADAPVCSVSLPDRRTAYLVTRYDDVVRALKDARFAKDRHNALTPEQLRKQPWIPPMFEPLNSNMLDQDAPNHTRLRGLVHQAFTPRRIALLAERAQQLADSILDRIIQHGRIELISEYALPIPVTIIADMLGIPDRDRRAFHGWSNAVIKSTASRWGMLMLIPSMLRFMRYIRRILALRRAEPCDDLLSALVQAEESGDQLSEDELVAMVMLLLIAGHETTVNLIGNGTFALLSNPDQLARLKAEPALIKPAIEELLRYESPVEMATERYAREDIELAATVIPRGSLVLLVLASANRDEAQFPRADMLDISRAPNRHLAFGQGIHYCLGAPLARLEGEIAISTLLRRLPELHLAAAPEALNWRRGLILRGIERLPLAFTPAPGNVVHHTGRTAAHP